MRSGEFALAQPARDSRPAPSCAILCGADDHERQDEGAEKRANDQAAKEDCGAGHSSPAAISRAMPIEGQTRISLSP